jgi:hypothetical protein
MHRPWVLWKSLDLYLVSRQACVIESVLKSLHWNDVVFHSDDAKITNLSDVKFKGDWRDFAKGRFEGFGLAFRHSLCLEAAKNFILAKTLCGLIFQDLDQ